MNLFRFSYRLTNTSTFYYGEEEACAEFVKRLNWKNPQKKTSVRRLTRAQRNKALIQFGKIGYRPSYISPSSIAV